MKLDSHLFVEKLTDSKHIFVIVILFEEINAVTDAPHYFLACKKEGNISSINGAIGLHCGCEITCLALR